MHFRRLMTSAAIGAALAAMPVYAQDGVDEEPVYEEIAADTANWREVPAENLFIFTTTKGRVLIEAMPEIAPNHVERFRTLIQSGLYDGTSFHRVIDGFMAQGGDIEQKTGETLELPLLKAEFTFNRNPMEFQVNVLGEDPNSRNGYYKGVPIRTQSAYLAELTEDGMIESWIPHCPGVVSTARIGGQPDSAKAQFFLLRATSEFLDRNYTAWGRMVEGLTVVRQLKEGEPVEDPDILLEAKVAADLPIDERPQVWVRRTDGPEFRANVLNETDIDEDVCNLPPVSTVVKN